MLMEEIIKQKDEEIKRLHEVYDVENIMKMVETLNDENDKLYNEVMMYKNKLYHGMKSYKQYKSRVSEVISHIKPCFDIDDDTLAIGLIDWLQESDSSEDED